MRKSKRFFYVFRFGRFVVFFCILIIRVLGLSLVIGVSLIFVEICLSVILLSLVVMFRSLEVGVLADGRALSVSVYVDSSFAV